MRNTRPALVANREVAFHATPRFPDDGALALHVLMVPLTMNSLSLRTCLLAVAGLAGCGGMSTLTVSQCASAGLSLSFDTDLTSLPASAELLTVSGACESPVESTDVEWTISGSSQVLQGSQLGACRGDRFTVQLPAAGFTGDFTVEANLRSGPCKSSRVTTHVSRMPVATGGGSAGGAAGGTAGGVAMGGGVAAAGGTAAAGGNAAGGGPLTGPGACAAPEVFAFCSGAARLGRPPDESALINQLAAQYPTELNRCARRNDEFKRIALAALRARDPRWGNNLVRGTAGDTNGNVIGYYYGPGAPTEGSNLTMLVELVSNCETATPTGARTATWRLVSPTDSEVARCCQPVGTVGIDAKAWTLLNTGTAGGAGGGGAGGGGAGGGAGGTCGDAFTTTYCAGPREPPNELALIQQLAAQHPTEFYNCDRHQDDFVQLVVRALRARDPRWGFNWVRGVVGDSNGDVVGYYYGAGTPTENSRFVTIVDIVGGCGAAGQGESVTWNVIPEASPTECCAPTGAEGWTLTPLR